MEHTLNLACQTCFLQGYAENLLVGQNRPDIGGLVPQGYTLKLSLQSGKQRIRA
ncbi:hypothetical protein D3C72_2442930 [compost metagenome]